MIGSQRMAIAALLLLFSGAAALVYQVLWIKQLSLIVGIDVYAVTAGISAFFGGLALGGLVLGRLADRVAQPLWLYAVLEAGIAALGVATTIVLANAAAPFARLEAVYPPLAWALCLVLLGVAPFIMGGTLPALMRAIGAQSGHIGAAGGRLYAANTIGAVTGALLVPFWLIPAFGVQGTALAAAVLNGAAALGACALARGMPHAASATARRLKPATPPAADARAAIVLYAVAGGIALGYEVIWSQAIMPFMSTRSFAFAVILATYLTGLAIGSALLAHRVDRLRNPWGLFGFLIAAAGLAALAGIALLGPWIAQAQTRVETIVLALTGNDLAGITARFALAAASVVLVPTVLLGAAFPIVLRLAADARHVGRDVGTVVALNTLGGIAGTMLTGFVLVPALGLVRSLATLAVCAAILGLLAAMRAPTARRGAWTAAAVTGTVTLIIAVTTQPDSLAMMLGNARRGAVISYDESPGGTVAVIEQSSGQNRFRRLYIQGISNSGDAMPSLRYMRLQALLPLIVHNGEPRAALVIGFGTGITAGALLRYPELDKRAVAELLPAVVRAGAEFRGNYEAATTPRLDIRLRDGRRELLRSPERYDLITLEPPPPSAAGVVNLYSRDFYQLAATRLRDQGIVAQWLPIATQNDGDTRSLVRSFIDVFPHASLWTSEFHEMLLIGSLQPLTLDAARIAQRFEQNDVAATLREVGIGSAAALLATFVTDRAGLERYAGTAPAVTDDRPRIEYASWVGRRELAKSLPALLALRTDPPLQNADDALTAAIKTERDRLMTFYSAGLHAYRGDHTAWASDIARLRREDGRNPYYGWFIGRER